jgi:phosphoribosylamine--glycine ligase
VRVLVVGGGGREHALCWALAQSPAVDRLFAAPGNAGITELATRVPIDATDGPALAEFAERESIDLTVVGPEAPLVSGLADALGSRGLPVFGPTAAGARLEGSKTWARALCEKHGIPVPRSRAFTQVEPALAFIEELAVPYVVKADGLAAGKGVTIAEDQAEAERAVRRSLEDRAFGDAGTTVLVEEFVQGHEVSALALTDGHDVLPLALARDYKRALDGDRGPNTGGMGSFSPVPSVEPTTERLITDGILRATVRALEAEGVRYRGVVYAGLMLTAEGPKVLEFNCRFGDPETQVILPRLRSSLAELLLACVEGNLGQHRTRWTDEACVGVVLASGGYPGPFATGLPISGLDQLAGVRGVQAFHAGTEDGDGRVVTAGGRVLTVTALGSDLEAARARAYEACSLIEFDGMHVRRDIGDLGEERG